MLCLAHYLIAPAWWARIICQLGFRSEKDIEHEKLALRALRGDFQCLPVIHNVEIEDRNAVARFEGEGGIAVNPDLGKQHMVEVVKEVLEVTQR